VEINARYYDGRTSRVQEVRLFFGQDGRLGLTGEGLSSDYVLADVEIGTRIGDTPRTLVFPDGGKCEIRDNNTLDDFLSRNRLENGSGWIHRLESHLRYVVLAVLVTAVFSWGMVAHGIPWLAERTAYALPPAVDRALGQGTLKLLDRSLFSASEIAAETRDRLHERFRLMIQALEAAPHYRLEFRNGGKIGANALALPSGIIVVTDELVQMSNNDDEIAAIIAHEVGHLVHRHSIRMVMQDSAVTLLIAAVTGDPFSTSGLAVALPTVLIHASYSQAFETEADDYAYRYLVNNQIPTRSFADILVRITDEEDESLVEKYISTHPGTRKRIERFR
jgi:Zn-dependent protease with chaperone function